MSRSLSTRLTELFHLESPVLSAPMAHAGSPKLAAAVSEAGGLGLIGGGYGLEYDIDRAFAELGGTRAGIGFITWSLARHPELLQQALKHKPSAVMLSFGSPAPFAPVIHSAGVPLICQCQNMAHVHEALEAGATAIVAQGSEAGGHGAVRGTMSFVAEAADLLAARSPSTLLLAAGGIADGRGLAASLMLGADGVLLGSRFWASAEANVPAALQGVALKAGGDATVRSSIPDIARGLAWPRPFNIRTLENSVIRDWSEREHEVLASSELREQLSDQYHTAAAKGDPENTAVIVGEAVGLIHDCPSAKVLVSRITAEAIERLSHAGSFTRCRL